MRIVTGIDLVYLPRFQKSLKNGGENFLRRVYLESELSHLGGGLKHLRGEIEHLAGIFAAKEAVIKALSLPPDSWHDIRIISQPNGAPQVSIIRSHLNQGATLTRMKNCTLSISHDGNYVLAQFVAVIE